MRFTTRAQATWIGGAREISVNVQISLELRRPGSAGHGRYLDIDRAGVSGVIALETLRLSAGAQPDDPFRDRTALSFPDSPTLSVLESAHARALLGILDESGDWSYCRNRDSGFRFEGILDHSNDSAHHRGGDGRLVVLCAASI